jgi:hypothetical protein
MSESFPGAEMMFTQGNHDIPDLMGPVFDERHSEDPLWHYPDAATDDMSNFSSNPATSIYQKDFTVYENASMNDICQDVPGEFLGGGYLGGNQGDPEEGVSQKSANLISILEDGRTVIRRLDVTNDRWMGTPWAVDTATGKAGFAYSDAQRSTTAPRWEKARISAHDIAARSPAASRRTRGST